MDNHFAPPSDFAPEPAGPSSSRRWWRYLGIGCAGFFVIGAILVALGVFKAVSCCSDVVEVGQFTAQVQQEGVAFATALGEGQLDAAYARTSAAYQSRTSREAFEALVAPHRAAMAQSAPHSLDIRARNSANPQENGSGNPLEVDRWVYLARFAAPTSPEVLILTVDFAAHGAGDTRKVQVEDLAFERRQRDLGAEPPAQVVLGWHRDVRAANYEVAVGHWSPSVRGSMAPEAVRAMINAQGDRLKLGQPTVESVAYQGPERARVAVVVELPSGARARLTYELEGGYGVQPWHVLTMQGEELPTAAPHAASGDVPVPSTGGSEADGGPGKAPGGE